jgi:hypothetical protein
MPPSLVLTNAQKVKLTIAPVDAAGNPAAIDGLPEWSDINGLFAFEAADGPLSIYAITLGPVGQTSINVTADADLGEGAVPISGSLEVEVVASQAVTLSIVAGTPEPK